MKKSVPSRAAKGKSAAESFNLKLPADLVRRGKAAATAIGESWNDFVIGAAREKLDREENQSPASTLTSVTIELPASTLKWAEEHAESLDWTLGDLVGWLLELEKYRAGKEWVSHHPHWGEARKKGGAR